MNKFRKCCGRRTNLPHASTCSTRIVPTDRAGVFELRSLVTVPRYHWSDTGGSGTYTLIRDAQAFLDHYKTTKEQR